MFHFHHYKLKQTDRDGQTWHMTRILEECPCGQLRIVSVPGWWYLDGVPSVKGKPTVHIMQEV